MKRISTDPGKLTGQTAPRGRPKSNVGQYILRADPSEQSGFTVLNSTPDTIQAAKESYLGKWELPPALSPRYLRRPAVLSTMKGRNISQGFVNPKSHMG